MVPGEAEFQQHPHAHIPVHISTHRDCAEFKVPSPTPHTGTCENFCAAIDDEIDIFHKYVRTYMYQGERGRLAYYSAAHTSTAFLHGL